MTDQVVVPARWRKSSRSSGGNGNTCVEVGSICSLVAVRDTKFRAAGMLTMDDGAWRGLIADIRENRLS